MRLRLCAPLIALCASLSLAVPAWAASFGTGNNRPTIDDQTFGLPGSSCAGAWTAPVDLMLPAAAVFIAGETPTYTLTDGTCTPSTGQTACGLPPGLTLTGDTLSGTLAADLKTATAAHYSLTWTVTDSAGPDSLTFEVAIVDERPVLEDLYTDTNGATWTTRTNWAADIPATTCLNDLHGITLQGNGTGSGVGRVSEITLPNNNLTGAMPESLGNPDGHGHEHGHEDEEGHEDEVYLKRLKVLNLANNRLTGAIPEGLNYLDLLYTINLANNRLTGAIPADITDLHFLDTLDLANNELTGPIPEAVYHEGFPHPGHTQHVILSHNKLTGPIPTTLAPLMPDLLTLDLSHNELTGEIPALPNGLTTLNLAHNRLTGAIPNGLTSLARLSTLDLSHNRLTGAIPSGLGSLAALFFLYLNNNQLRGEIPTTLPPALVLLNLSNNRLQGEIPGGVANLTRLSNLDLSHNQLSEEVPDLSGLTTLLSLTFSHNKLSGEIPTLPGGFSSSLAVLHLDNNRFSGEIPSSLGFISSLTSLRLSNNQLSGGIPTDLVNLFSLTELWLQNNQLTGAIPALPFTLKTLYLHNNRLAGNLAPLAILTFLEELSLYDNPRRRPPTLYAYPSPTLLNPMTALHLVVPNTGYTMCLPSTMGGDDCTIPTKVDQLFLGPAPTRISAVWVQPSPVPSGYVVEYYTNAWVSTNVAISPVPPSHNAAAASITGLTPGGTYRVRVRPASADTPWLLAEVTLPLRSGTGGSSGGSGGGGSGGGGGGGGGGTRTPADRHGDTPDAATSLNPRRYTTGVISRTLTAHLQSRRDVDYFTLTLPYPGVLTAHTTGADTTGRLYQAQQEGDPLLVTDTTASALGTAVEAGTYYLAVLAGRGSGEYRLTVHYTPAFAGNPAPDSPQSGVSVLSGWVCEADTVKIEFETALGDIHLFEAATGTSRPDTAVACGADTTATGYGLLFNWNRLGDGEYTVRVIIDDVVLAERQITVTTLGPHADQEFRRDLPALTTEIPDFPAVGETTTLRWQPARQNFVIARGAGGGGGQQLTPEQAWLGNPAPGSFQSGVGVLSGWVCEAERVELVFETAAGTTFTEEAGYGTERMDTEGMCGDTDNGFGLLFNWNRLGDGQHTVRAYADGEEFGHSTFTVTTLGEEFAEGLARMHEIEDFPAEGQTTTVEWQQGQQNFVITGLQ